MKNKFIPVFLLAAALLFIQPSLSFAQYRFYCGEDWENITKSQAAEEVKTEIKTLIIKATQEASLLSGAPILPLTDEEFNKYIPAIDRLYQNPQDKAIPVYFALKIAEMEKNNFPEKQVIFYKTAIAQKIQQITSMEHN